MPDVVFSIFHGLRHVRYIVANVSLQRLFSVLNVFTSSMITASTGCAFAIFAD